MAKTKLLLVEDDPNFGAVLRDYLELHDYGVTLCTDGEQGLRTYRHQAFDACILDVMMPVKDGFTLAREIKKLNARTPVIFLTAKSMKADILEGFQIGADDYLTKPFDSEVLLYKIKAILNRQATPAPPPVPVPEPSQEYQIGYYQFNFKLRCLTLGDKKQKLSPKEAELLRLLCLHLNDVLPRAITLKQLWGEDNYFTTRSMDVFIAKLRKYLREDPRVEISNIHGNGFRLTVN
jgi:two-component system, OmpR family, response regulator